MKLSLSIWLAIAFVFVASFASAQEAADPTTTPVQWYTSAAGVAAATIVVVSVLKRAIGKVPALNAIPTWIYAVSVSFSLTFLTVQIWGTQPGELWQTLMQSVITASSASGFYEWLNAPTTSLAESASKAGVS